MKGVIFGKDSARSEADALMSADVGSSHDTTPERSRLECVGKMKGFEKEQRQTETTMIDPEDALHHELLARREPLQEIG